MRLTKRNIVGWIMLSIPLSIPLLVIGGGLVYRFGTLAVAIVVVAILLTWMIYKGVDLLSQDW